MPTPSQIARQIKLETQQVQEGIAKLHSDIEKANSRQYNSSTIQSQKLLKEAIPHVSKEIDRIRNNRLLRGSAGPALKQMVTYTMDIPSDVISMITLKILFDVTTSPKNNDDLVNNVVDRVGIAIEQEAKWMFFNEKDPELLAKIQWKLHKGKGLHYRDYKTTKDMKESGHVWKSWNRLDRVKLGAAFTDAAITITGWWNRTLIQQGKRRTVFIKPTEQLNTIVSSLIKQAELIAPFNWPMLCEPNQWTNEQHGGYYTNETRKGNKLIRTFGVACIQGETVLNFVNNLQSIRYRVNRFIYDVASVLEEKGIKVEDGKFIPEDRRPLPNKPHDIKTNETARKEYRKLAAEVYDYNSTALKRCIRTKLTMSMASKFVNEECYYIPWSFDYRGRVYPIPAFLTPQDTCFGKSLVEFADGVELNDTGKYWLQFQLATTYGLDKATMEERQEWIKPNLSLIEQVATDPIGNIHLWESVEEPFLFLAACHEYYELCIAKVRTKTFLPVAVDATCSGLQVLAGMSKDASTAALVNVTKGSKPSDAYKAIANKVNPQIPEDWNISLTRSHVKRVVMTIPYNAKPHSNRSYIRDALKKDGIEITPDQLTLIVKLTREAMHDVVEGAMKVMDWLNLEIGRAIKNGQPHIEWTTPSGFNVIQDLRKVETTRIKTHLLGRLDLNIGTSLGDPDLNHHKNAGAPNLIHSMDASILHIGLENFDRPFTVIHDSVLCLANDMDKMSEYVRGAYATCFTDHSPLLDFAKSINAETEPPMINTFDPSVVLDSPYFFC
nr:T7-like RNA polymerase [uncultured Mediterranean phage uvMED]BAR25521.1 T7-like RNA polymerase [uncultured Mediterranean phage uvMED]